MAPSDYEAPEVRAVRGSFPARPIKVTVGRDIDTLLNQMIEADEVYIVGVLPWECSRRLIELQQSRGADAQPAPKTVNYLIPRRDDKGAGKAMGPRVQRWVAGVFGVRNWVIPHRDESRNRDRLRIRLLDDDAGAHVVLTRRGEHFEATQITYLISLSDPAAGLLAIAECDPATTDKIRAHVIDDLLPRAPIWEIRQVRCYGPLYEASTDQNRFTPRIWRLTRERQLQPDETEPAVIVAVCGHTSEGPAVVLKRRRPSNSLDDFDRLSLISEHVIVEDLVDWVKRVPTPLDADDTRAREQIWKAAGRPTQLILRDQFFEEAAQRELYVSCGLNIEAGRLDLRGYRRVRREDGTHLGFAIFRLDLRQDDDVDELEIIDGWSKDMVPVPIDRLYTGNVDVELNRLLRLQREWLVANVFSPARPTPNGAGPRPVSP